MPVNYCHHDFVDAPDLEEVFSKAVLRRRFRVCLKCVFIEEITVPLPRPERSVDRKVRDDRPAA